MYVYTLFENISIVPNVLVSNENVKIGKANFKSYCIFDFFFLILCIWIRHEDIGGKAHTLNPWMYTNAAPKNTPQQEVCFETIETLLHFILNIYFSIFFSRRMTTTARKKTDLAQTSLTPSTSTLASPAYPRPPAPGGPPPPPGPGGSVFPPPCSSACATPPSPPPPPSAPRPSWPAAACPPSGPRSPAHSGPPSKENATRNLLPPAKECPSGAAFRLGRAVSSSRSPSGESFFFFF